MNAARERRLQRFIQETLDSLLSDAFMSAVADNIGVSASSMRKRDDVAQVIDAFVPELSSALQRVVMASNEMHKLYD